MLKDCSCLSASHRLRCVIPAPSQKLRGSRNNWCCVHSYHGPILLWGDTRECRPGPGGHPSRYVLKASASQWHVKSRRAFTCCFSWLLVTVFTFLPTQNRYFSCTRQVFTDSSCVLPLSFPKIIIIGLAALTVLFPSNCDLTHWVWMRPRGCSSC